MKALTELQPPIIWHYFDEILRIPRPSGKEKEVGDYVLSVARKYKLEYKKDKAGNILVSRKAGPGFENLQPVCLQSHLDMVCEKNGTSPHNFDTDPIEAYVDGEWVRARETTLGADNGIGIAAQLAVLTDQETRYGPVECLFTVDEETGLNGAKCLESGFFQSRVLLNLDSEDEGELFIGCAGGMNTLASIKYKSKRIPADCRSYQIVISGLLGGHSGTDIHKERGNSVKILNEILWEARNRFDMRLAVFEGGNLRNAIPREAYAVIVIPLKYVEVFEEFFRETAKRLVAAIRPEEPDFSITLDETEHPPRVLKKKLQEKLLNALYICPNGVIAWSKTMPDLVETSTNLASVKFGPSQTILITTSQRSSDNAAKQAIANKVRSTFKLAGAKVEHSEGYPGWNPDPSSSILSLTETAYKRIFGTGPKIKAMHAGLECGLFLEKYPYLDMISFGPTILDAHSPNERLHIGTTEKFWTLLKEVLKNMPER
ncbi:MAG: cytosol nonspecific dipeptidase [Bacteroidetes bacterium RBG_13_46_8]|nr:MAG: cytosol nonspecific dipeptidase [Bacteroidetes bacterium RBG_13_46_8]